MFLNSIVKSSLALNVLSVDISPVPQQELTQLYALHTVDEAGTAVKIWFLNICTICDKQLHYVKVGHEAG